MTDVKEEKKENTINSDRNLAPNVVSSSFSIDPSFIEEARKNESPKSTIFDAVKAVAVNSLSKLNEVIQNNCIVVLGRPKTIVQDKMIANAVAKETGGFPQTCICNIPTDSFIRVVTKGGSHLLNLKSSIVFIRDNNLVSIPLNKNVSPDDILNTAKKLFNTSKKGTQLDVTPSACVAIPNCNERKVVATNY